MARHAHRKTPTTLRTAARAAWKRARRSRAARHAPFAGYVLITVFGMGYVLWIVCRATG